MFNIISFIQTYLGTLVAILGGILYRLGGAGNVNPNDKFNWLRDTLTRDLGMCLLIGLMIFVSNLYGAIGVFLSMGLTYGISTCGYGGKGEPPEEQSDLYRLFGKYVFFAVGFGFGLALLPYAIGMAMNSTPIWKAFGIRVTLLTILIPLIHEWRTPIFGFDSAQVEEFLRGHVIIITCLVF